MTESSHLTRRNRNVRRLVNPMLAVCAAVTAHAAFCRAALAVELVDVAVGPRAVAGLEAATFSPWLTWFSGTLLAAIAGLGLWQLRRLAIAARPTSLAARTSAARTDAERASQSHGKEAAR